MFPHEKALVSFELKNSFKEENVMEYWRREFSFLSELVKLIKMGKKIESIPITKKLRIAIKTRRQKNEVVHFGFR
jgi:hypothetical protein